MDGEQITAIKHQLKDDGYNIYVYSFPGGMCFPVHSHDYDTIHIVLSGSLKISMNGSDFFLTPGERFTIPANTPHSAEILGDTPVVCLDATKPSTK